jgi:hypothetical protein
MIRFGSRTALLLLAAVLAVGLGGCKVKPIPDPNDPNDVGNAQPEVLRNALKGAADALFDRVHTGELTDAEAQDKLSKYADTLLSSLKMEKVPHDKAWEYGEVFRAARRWKQAKVFLEIAVKYANTQDRFVNDSIRLAAVDCMLKDVPTAIKLVRGTFTAYPENKAPILYGALYDVVPAGEGQGHDVELAQLLQDSIAQAMKTRVDPKSEAGSAFLMARGHHVGVAWLKVVQMFTDANRPDLARKAEQEAAKSSNSERAI